MNKPPKNELPQGGISQIKIPLPATRLPALEPLINGSLWQEWAAAGRVFPLKKLASAVRYLRLKPLTSCRMTLFVDADGIFDRPPAGFFLHLFTDAARARTAFEKARDRDRGEGAPDFAPFLSESPPLVAYPFSIDPELPNLRHIYEPDRFRRALHEFLPQFPESEWRIQKRLCQTRLVAYKPGRRAVYRVKIKLRHLERDEKARAYLHVKVSTPEDAERSHASLVGISGALAAGGTTRVPRPAGISKDLSLVAAEWVEGRDLFALMQEKSAGGSAAAGAVNGAAVRDAVRGAGRALAELHALDLSLPHTASPPEESEELLALARDLAELLPEEGGRLLQLGDLLASLISRFALLPSEIVHGDFHPGQVLATERGVVLVDFDAAGRGYGALDLGSFLARLIELGVDSELAAPFLSGYREASGAAPEEELLDIATAVALFRRSMFPLRALRADWREEMLRLAAASERLAGKVRS